MERSLDMKDGIVLLVREFLETIEVREPFETELMEFRLHLRAKLLQVATSFPADPPLVNRNLNYVFSALQEALAEGMEKVNRSSEVSLLRTIKTLSVMNEVLKEFMYKDSIRDKKQLSALTGFIGASVERLKGEHKKQFGGLMAGLRKIFSPKE